MARRSTGRSSPGPLGVDLNAQPAAEAILAQREVDALLRRTRGAAFDPLPGSRREVQAIAGLFDQSMVLLGSDASEQTLEALRDRGRAGDIRRHPPGDPRQDGRPVADELAAVALAGQAARPDGRIIASMGRLTTGSCRPAR